MTAREGKKKAKGTLAWGLKGSVSGDLYAAYINKDDAQKHKDSSFGLLVVPVLITEVSDGKKQK